MYELHQYTHAFFPSVLNINLLHYAGGVWLAVTICGAIDRKSETAVVPSHRIYGFAKPIVRRKGQRWSEFNDARRIPGDETGGGDRGTEGKITHTINLT